MSLFLNESHSHLAIQIISFRYMYIIGDYGFNVNTFL